MALNRKAQGLVAAAPPRSWRRALPVISDGMVTLRGLTADDAAPLAVRLNRPAVLEHMAAPPPSVNAFARFIRWSQAQRRRGTHACFAIVPSGRDEAVGIVQIWRVEPDFSTAEWGIVIGDTHWGRGIGSRASRLLFEFAFTTLGVTRLESRVASGSERGLKLMERLGATHEGTLRRAFRSGELVEDYEMWGLLVNEWKPAKGRERLADCSIPEPYARIS